MNILINPLRERLAALRALWAVRQPRERRFMVALVVFIGCALIVQGLWSSHVARSKLRGQIPQLRQQLEAMEHQAGEIRQMRAQSISPAAQEGPGLTALAMTAARGVGLALVPGQIQVEGPRQLRLRADLLPFDALLEWVAVLQRDARLRLVRCRIDATEVSGMVKVEVSFALPEPS